MANVCSRLVEVGIIFLVVFTPIYYGSVSLGATTLIELTVLSMLLIWAIGMIVQGDFMFRRTPLDIPILVFCAYCVVSTLLFSEYRYASYTGLLLVLCVSALYFIVINHIRSEIQLMRLFVVVLLVGFIHAFSHLVQNASGLFRASTGVMLNVGNHFAGYMVIVIPLAVAVSFVVKDMGKRILLIFSSIVMAAAMAFSLIAGAMLAFLLSLVLVAVLFAGSESTREKALILGGTVFCLLLVIFWIGHTPVLKELLTVTNLKTGSAAGRLSLWKSSFAMFAGNPITGTGLGTFDYVYPRYRLPDMYGRAVYAHSDWLQLLTELGVVGFVIFVSGVVYSVLLIGKRYKEVTTDGLCVTCNRSPVTRHSSPVNIEGGWTKGLVVGGLSSIGAGLAHALVEFNFHIPAIAVLFAIIVALTVVGCSMGKPANRRVCNDAHLPIRSSVARIIVFICLIPVAGFSGVLILRPYLADTHYRNGMKLEEELLWDEAAAEYQSALSVSHNNSYYFYALGNVYAKRASLTRGMETQAEWAKLALHAYDQAIEFCPIYGDYHLVLGNLHEVIGDKEDAEAAYVKAISLDPNNAFYHRIYGSFCLKQGQFGKRDRGRRDTETRGISLSPCPERGVGDFPHQAFGVPRSRGSEQRGPRREKVQKAIAEYKKALAVYPRDLSDILNECYAILDSRLSMLDGQIQCPIPAHSGINTKRQVLSIAQEIRPQGIGSCVTSARFCVSKGWHDAAISEYQRAIALAEANAVRRDPQAHAELALVYIDQERLDDAIQQYLTAANIDPGNSDYLIRAADLYMQKGESSEALRLWQTSIREKPHAGGAAYYRLGRYYEDQGDWIRALGFFQQAIAADPENIGYRLHLAESYYGKELLYEAIQEWERALSLQPGNVSIHLQLARVHQRIGVQDRARQHYRQAIELQPENVEAQRALEMSK